MSQTAESAVYGVRSTSWVAPFWPRRRALSPVGSLGMRKLAILVAVLIVFSACTADTTEKVLRVSVSDETSGWESGSSGLPNLEVWVPGTGSWFPDTSFGGDVSEAAGPFRVGETTEIFIYPDGRDDPEFAVEVLVDADIIAGSVRDMIQITVDDATVNVFGTSIPGFEVNFQR